MAHVVRLSRHRASLLKASESVRKTGGSVEWIRNPRFWEHTDSTPYFFGPVELGYARSTLFLGNTQIFVSYERQEIGQEAEKALGNVNIGGVTFFECDFRSDKISFSKNLRYCIVEDFESTSAQDINIILASIEGTKVEYLDVFTDEFTAKQLSLIFNLPSLRILQFHSDSMETIELRRDSDGEWVSQFPFLEKANLSVQVSEYLKGLNAAERD